jgi:hypothetical protein
VIWKPKSHGTVIEGAIVSCNQSWKHASVDVASTHLNSHTKVLFRSQFFIFWFLEWRLYSCILWCMNFQCLYFFLRNNFLSLNLMLFAWPWGWKINLFAMVIFLFLFYKFALVQVQILIFSFLNIQFSAYSWTFNFLLEKDRTFPFFSYFPRLVYNRYLMRTMMGGRFFPHWLFKKLQSSALKKKWTFKFCKGLNVFMPKKAR